MQLPEDRLARIAYWATEIDRAEATGGNLLVRETMRALALADLFYLLTVILKRKDADRDWIFDRCVEVNRDRNGFLDLWAREHYKSTVITFALTIQDILRDPEVTIAIFSHTRPTAKKFLRQIKTEFEENADLKALFTDVLWDWPRKQAPKWSEDEGLIVRRESRPKEATLEAHGLVDGMPTGAHFKLRIYDDIIDQKHIRSPEMIHKTIEAWEMSINLGTADGTERYIGTRYHFADPYRTMMERKAVTARIYPCTDDGTETGEPVLLTRDLLADKRRKMGVYTFGSQMLQDPTADRSQGFKPEWIKRYDDTNHGEGMNTYILVDPASSKKKESDYTAMAVIGLASDENFYLLDAVRDRLNLTERADALFALHRSWRPIGVGYEKYGAQADVEYMRIRMAEENYRFDITELGGTMAKHDRIRRLVPFFEAERFYILQQLLKVDWEGKHVDIMAALVQDEIVPFPVGLHEDLLDAIARICDADMNIVWPKAKHSQRVTVDRYARAKPNRPRGSFMSA